MFHSSTQRQHWMFKSEGELQEKRRSVNGSFCEKQEKDKRMLLLDPTEELQLLHYYQKKLVEICSLFAPPHWAPLPRTALATAVMYLKRFYLNTSVMEYHPQDIFLCCTFLAFKIDEYNVTLDQFVQTISKSPFFPSQQLEQISEFILSHELFLLQKLKFHLTIHSPFRPLGGFIIDMKTRFPDLHNPDKFRKIADKFLILSLHSDVGLLYPPSQIALTSLWYSAKQTENDINGYLSSILLGSETPATVESVTNHLQKIEEAVLATTLPDRSSISTADEKLSQVLVSSSSRKRKLEDSAIYGAKKHKHSSDSSEVAGITPLH